MHASGRAPEVFVNPWRVGRDAMLPAIARADGPLAFHRRLPGYAPTPLVDAPGLAAELGLEHLCIKDESSRFGLPAFKVLGASWATYRVLVAELGGEPEWSTLDELRAALKPLDGLTLATATDGNHGRAVARMAKLLGFGARIFVPAGTAVARIDAIEGEGASVTVVDGSYDDAVRAAAARADSGTVVVSDTSWPGYEEVPRWVIDGYSTIFHELPLEISPDVVFVQVGVGALAAAVVSEFANRAVVVAVEPESAACALSAARAGEPVEVPGPHRSIMAGLNCGIVSLVAWPQVRDGIDVFVAVDDSAAEHAMRDLASLGVVAGESGAAGLAGLRALIESGEFDSTGKRALVFNTEGATDPENYARVVGNAPAPQ